jgi:hypothetical protein
MGFIHQGLGDLPLQTRQADVEASLEEAGASVSSALLAFDSYIWITAAGEEAITSACPE